MSRRPPDENDRDEHLPEDLPQDRHPDLPRPVTRQRKRKPMNSKNTTSDGSTPDERDEALTRLLLDEVSTDERATLEVLINSDPVARRAYEERRAAIEMLRSGGKIHDSLRLSADRRAGIFAGNASSQPARITPMRRAEPSPVERPQGWFAYSGVAAALLLAGILFFLAPEEGSEGSRPSDRLLLVDHASSEPATGSRVDLVDGPGGDPRVHDKVRARRTRDDRRDERVVDVHAGARVHDAQAVEVIRGVAHALGAVVPNVVVAQTGVVDAHVGQRCR